MAWFLDSVTLFLGVVCLGFAVVFPFALVKFGRRAFPPRKGGW